MGTNINMTINMISTSSSDEIDNDNNEGGDDNQHNYQIDESKTSSTSLQQEEMENHHRSDSNRNHHRLITVVGLESSGTTFVATTIAKALGYTKTNSKDLFHNMLTIEIPQSTSATSATSPTNEDFTTTTTTTTTWVQHVSLPTGFFREHQEGFERRFELPPTVPVVVPDECKIPARYPYKPPQSQADAEVSRSSSSSGGRRNFRGRSSSTNRMQRPAYTKTCREILQMSYLMEYPNRYFVNLTSHVRWYQSRHVDVTVVVVVRDQSLHFRGILKTHCTNKTAAYEQFVHGRYIIQDAMTQLQQPQQQGRIPRDSYRPTNNEQGAAVLHSFNNNNNNNNSNNNNNNNNNSDHNELIIVSYETLMTLQETYLFDLYDQLGMFDATYIPEFVDGNAKYVSS